MSPSFSDYFEPSLIDLNHLSHLLYRAIGAGPTFTLLTALVLATSPLLLVVIKNGDNWRRGREDKAATLALENEKSGAGVA